MRTLSLTKPYVHTVKFSIDSESKDRFGGCHKNITYLNIPPILKLEDLRCDVKMGAVQFAELDALVKKENEPQYILLSVNNLEQGYLAVTYLAAAFNEKNNRNLFDDPELNLDDAENMIDYWDESPFQIPVIEEHELLSQIGDGADAMPFPIGNMAGLGYQPVMWNHPYWLDCIHDSVCVISRGRFPGESEFIERGLKYFHNNDKVYVLCLNEETVFEFCYEDDEGDTLEQIKRRKWNSVILALSMDEASVALEKKDELKYYKLLFQSVFKAKNIQIEKGFSYIKLINLIKDMTTRDKCKLVESVVNYAIKDKKPADCYVVSNKDFGFIDRFMRTKDSKLEKTEKKNAREYMLTKLIGLEGVKEQVLDVVNVMKYNRIRQEMNIQGGQYHNVHMMLGAPGTAKTTIAKLMGQIMLEEKLLPDDRFICINGAELKGKYVGHSAPKTKALFEENDIIVIDEAYSIVSDKGEDDSFSKEALAQLIIEIENHSTDKLVIFAGYGGKNVSEKNNKMKAFLDANPGIKSRITSTIYFDSYTVDEMVTIFFHIAKNSHYIVESEAKDLVRAHFAKRINDDNFGNGREARSLLETTAVYAAKRLFGQEKKKFSKADMQTIKREDVEKAIAKIEKVEEIQQPIGRRNKIGFV